jgi:HSP20 family protein
MERRFFGNPAPTMKTDIRENDREFVLEADLPGFAKEDIRAEIKNGILTLCAEHKTEKNETNGETRYVRKERSLQSYRRSFELNGIDTAAITAAYKDGVLTVTLPKLEPKKEETQTLTIN